MAANVLRNPRKKKGANKIPKESPFPVPIESITKKEACDSRWFYYTGYFRDNCVVVEDLGDLTYLFKMGFFGKGILSRSKPEYEMISDISQRAFSNSDRFRRLPPKERKIRQSKFRKIRKERYRNHLKWQKLATTTTEMEMSRADAVEITETAKVQEHITDSTQCSSEPETSIHHDESVKIKIDGEDELDLCQDDANDSNNDSDDTSDSSDQDDQTDKDNKDSDEDANKKKQEDFPKPKGSEEMQNIQKSKKRKGKKVDPYKVYEHLQLSLEEAFFLSYGLGCLKVYDENKKQLTINDTWKVFCQAKRNFIPCYVAYHYYRSKGWVPKCGMKYGTDFVIYKEGMPFYHSSYSVIVQTADKDNLEPTPIMADQCQPFTWSSITGLNRVSEHAAKEIMICYVLVPSDITQEELSHPCCIPRLEVKEVLLRRWVPERSRESNK